MVAMSFHGVKIVVVVCMPYEQAYEAGFADMARRPYCQPGRRWRSMAGCPEENGGISCCWGRWESREGEAVHPRSVGRCYWTWTTTAGFAIASGTSTAMN
jgi:hypothetical protein